MFTVYVPQSVNYNFRYVGFTNNLNRRIGQHNRGKNTSTKHYKPFKLIYFENCETRIEARRREKFLKSTKGRNFINEIIREEVPALAKSV